MEKYIKLHIQYFKKDNFCLESHQKPTAKTWYVSHVVGQHLQDKETKTKKHDARIDGFFRGYSSLRRFGTIGLF